MGLLSLLGKKAAKPAEKIIEKELARAASQASWERVNGLDEKLYHGTHSGPFDEFDLSRVGSGSGAGTGERAFWLTPSERLASEFGRPYPFTASGKFKEVDARGQSYKHFDTSGELEKARREGYDGVRFKRLWDTKNYDGGNLGRDGDGQFRFADQVAVFDPRNARPDKQLSFNTIDSTLGASSAHVPSGFTAPTSLGPDIASSQRPVKFPGLQDFEAPLGDYLQQGGKGGRENFLPPIKLLPREQQPLFGGTPEALARAKGQGFDINTPLYRGMSQPGEFRTDSIGLDHQGPGISATPDVDYAHVYARSAREGPNGEPPYLYEGTQPVIYPLYGRGPYVDETTFSAARDQLMRERGLSRADAAKAAQEDFRGKGFTGWQADNGSEVRVWPNENGDVTNLRSRFAAFNPDKKNSGDPLAGLALTAGAGLTTAAALGAPQDAEAMDLGPFFKRAATGANDRGIVERVKSAFDPGVLPETESHPGWRSEDYPQRYLKRTGPFSMMGRPSDEVFPGYGAARYQQPYPGSLENLTPEQARYQQMLDGQRYDKYGEFATTPDEDARHFGLDGPNPDGVPFTREEMDWLRRREKQKEIDAGAYSAPTPPSPIDTARNRWGVDDPVKKSIATPMLAAALSSARGQEPQQVSAAPTRSESLGSVTNVADLMRIGNPLYMAEGYAKDLQNAPSYLQDRFRNPGKIYGDIAETLDPVGIFGIGSDFYDKNKFSDTMGQDLLDLLHRPVLPEMGPRKKKGLMQRATQ